MLHQLAKIVHSADTRDTGLAPEDIGLSAVMTGARFNAKMILKPLEELHMSMTHFIVTASSSCFARNTKEELEKMDRDNRENS